MSNLIKVPYLKERLDYLIIKCFVGGKRITSITCHFNTRFNLFKELQSLELFDKYVEINKTNCKYIDISIKTSFDLKEDYFEFEVVDILTNNLIVQ